MGVDAFAYLGGRVFKFAWLIPVLVGWGFIIGTDLGVAQAWGADSPPQHDQTKERPPQPVFSDAQATAGKTSYERNCTACHGINLDGGGGSPLAGPAFLRRWANGRHKLDDLYTQIATLMPATAPASLSKEEYTDLLAYILARNGFAAGREALTPRDLQITLLPPGADAAPLNSAPAKLPAPPQSIAQASTNRPDDDELLKADSANWLMYNKDYGGDRYSALSQLTTENVAGLAPVCAFQAGETGSFVASPVVYDGIMYVTTPFNTFALNARTCTKLWQQNFQGELAAPVIVNRGVALYRGKVFRCTPDGHLLALDAKTGKVLWDVWMSDASVGRWLSAAPIVYSGKVITGEAGGDDGVSAHIYAFDSESGKLLWTFDVIPTGTQPGADSWIKGAEHGGGSMWSTFSVDTTKGLVLASVGNPAPAYYGSGRPGDNLYTDSVVALDANTGRLAWYRQQIPHDTHDWDTGAAPVVYSRDGTKYIAVANKGGWLYLYDASSRRLIEREEVSKHLNIDVPITPAGVHACPGYLGGVEWNGPAYSPKLGTLFVNSVDWCGVFNINRNRFIEGSVYMSGGFAPDPADTASGWTRAFDATTGKPLWANKTKTPMIAALTPTAGDVLFTGDLDGYFLALDAKTGKTLYRFNTGGAIAGASSTYLVDGKQFVSVVSGNASRSVWQTTGAATVFVFALPGN